jgi:hypothetical protein
VNLRRAWKWALGGGLATAGLAAGVALGLRPEPGWVAGELRVVKENGGWCWFQDPRAIIDGDRVLVGTIAGTSAHGSHAGDLEVSSLSLVDGARESSAVRSKFQSDDHDSPSLAILGDGRYLAVYSKHSNDNFLRWKVSRQPHDLTSWEPEGTLDVGGYATYSNTFILSSKPDRIYSFHRGFERNPNVMVGTGRGADFRHAGRLFRFDLTEKTGAVASKRTGISQQPKSYVQYASDGRETIHFLATECHPRCYDNSVYHGFVRDDAVHDSRGRVLDRNLLDQKAANLTRFTRIFEGDPDHVAWTVDLEIDAGGMPYAVFSVQLDDRPNRHHKSDDGGFDNRYRYARFDGTDWQVHELAHAGSRLYAREHHYTGLAALHPMDPDVVYLSTNADPVTGAPLISKADGERHHEIFRGRTNDRGATWRWEPITRDSPVDNLRPIIPRHEGKTVLLWLRGTYQSMGTYDQDVVALVDP